MPKRFNITEDELKKLFYETKNLTENFKKFDLFILAENSQRIIVFRLLMGMSMDKFSRFVNRTRGSVYNLEKERKTIPLSV